MRSVWAWGLAVLPIAIVGGLVTFATLRPVTVLPRQGLAPGFVLTAPDGAAVSSESLRGAVVLYSFVTDVGAGGPGLDLAHAVRQRLAEVGGPEPAVRLVTVAVEATPNEDPRPTLGGGPIDPAQWALLSGDAVTLKRVIGAGFDVFYGPSPAGPVTIEPALTLVDGWGIIRAEYRQPLPAADTVLRDLRLVTDEARQNTGVARYAYEAAHLFACYPR